MRSVWRYFVLAWQFFTIIPAPRIQPPTMQEMRRSALFLPLVGLALGGIFAGVDWGFARFLPAGAVALLALVVYTLCTGALHVDGLMDTADAIGSRKPRDEALAIMKDSRVGAMGAVAAVLLLGGKWVALFELPSPVLYPLFLIPMLSRLGLLWMMALLPAAKPEGLGSLFAKQTTWWTAALATIATWLIACLLAPVAAIAVYTLVLAAIVVCFSLWMRRRFGGMTGDTYGAFTECAEWLLWFVALAVTTPAAASA